MYSAVTKEIIVTNVERVFPRIGSEILVPDSSMVGYAEWVSEQTKASGTMLPKRTEEVLKVFEEGRAVLIVDRDGEPIAHAAITFLYEEERVLELGAVIVEPNLRRRGFGFAVARAVSEQADRAYPGWKKMVLCNDASLPIFLALGGVMIGQDSLDMVPEATWVPCQTCPNYQSTKALGKVCCDTVVIIP